MNSHHPGVTNFVHVGLVVENLDETVRFLELLGLDCDEPTALSGKWIDQIIGLEHVRIEMTMARTPDGSDIFGHHCRTTRRPGPKVPGSGNTEIFGFDGDKLSRVEVYFGWNLD